MENPADKLKTEFSKLTEDSRKLIKDLRTNTSTQSEVDEKRATYEYLKDTLEYLENQSKVILTKKSYLSKSPEGHLIVAKRKATREVDDVRWYINNINLEEIKERKEKHIKETEENEKLFKVGEYFYYGYYLNKITKVTPTMIKYKQCDSVSINSKDLGGFYFEYKEMILADDLQKFDTKKERSITKAKIRSDHFTDEKGIKFEFDKPWTKTIDMGR